MSSVPTSITPRATLLTLTLLIGTLHFAAPAAGQAVFINELHYDNDGGDTGEAVEIAGEAGTDLTGWSLVLYNGNGGGTYDTLPLSATLTDQCGGYGTATLTPSSLQNGAPDGLALVDASENVVQFLSYEGTFTATGGPAEGLTSTDIGVSEEGSTPEGLSLQLTGDGTSYEDFTWTAPSASSFGAPNEGQSFGSTDCGPAGSAPEFTAELESQAITAGETFSFTYEATDADGDALSYSLAEAPSGASIGSETGLFEWTPTAGEAGGSYTVTARVSDGGLFDETTATLTVEAPPSEEAPVFTSMLGAEFVSAGSAFTFDYDAADPQDDAVTYALTEGPTGASIDSETGVLAWTPSAPGVAEFVVEATDGAYTATTRGFVGATGTLFRGETGSDLRASLRAAYAPDQTLGYAVARDTLYLRASRHTSGQVRGVYTGFGVVLPPVGVDPSSYLADRGINAEHIWPQSMGAGDEPARSDMHNLYPAKSNVNGARGNDPYAEIPDEETQAWYFLDREESTVPKDSLAYWSEDGSGAFEPREMRKGDVARAALYFYSIYETAEESFFGQMSGTLASWDDIDRPAAEELRRSALIRQWQGNINPFVLDTTLSSRLLREGSTESENELLPQALTLEVYPNPARGVATVRYALPEAARVRLVLYDVLGREVRVLAEGQMPAGRYAATLGAAGLPAGPYLARIDSGGRALTRLVQVVR